MYLTNLMPYSSKSRKIQIPQRISLLYVEVVTDAMLILEEEVLNFQHSLFVAMVSTVIISVKI
jgi:hypothetical protein